MIGGLFAAVGAAGCYELAYALQALEARRADGADAMRLGLLARLVRRPRWAAGTALSGVGAALQVVALALAPLAVVQPTLAVGLLALLVLARRMLGERPGARELAGVGAIVVGVAGVALAAPPHAGRSEAGLGLAIELAVLGAVATAPFAVRARGVPARLAVAGAAAGDAAAALGLKLAADALHRGTVAPAAGWVALAVVTGMLALTAEMSALQRLPATRVGPVVVGAQVLVPVVTGAALMGESWGPTPGHGAALGAAVALVAAGAVLLAGSPGVGGALAGRRAGEALQHERGGGGQPRE